MKCLCLTTDSNLINAVRNSNVFKSVESVSTFNNLYKSNLTVYNTLIISDNLAVYSSLEDIQKKIAPDSLMFYLMSNSHDSNLHRQIQMICLSLGITLIPPQLTEDQILAKILKIVSPGIESHTSNVVSLFGTQPGVGVTSLAMGIASKLSSIAKIKVGVLGLNVSNPGDCFQSKYTGLYLDEIKSYLSNKMFSEEQLNNNMFSLNSFKYLAGNRDIKKRLYYTIDEINYLIQLAKNIFDIILLDSGSQFDNALTVQSLLCSDLRLLVSTQNKCGHRCWQLAYEQIIEPLGYTKESFLIICNKFKDNVNLPKSKYIQELYNISVLQTIPDVGDLGLMAEEENSLLIDFKVKHYDICIENIVNNLIKLYGISIENKNDLSGKGIMSRLFFNRQLRW